MEEKLATMWDVLDWNFFFKIQFPKKFKHRDWKTDRTQIKVQMIEFRWEIWQKIWTRASGKCYWSHFQSWCYLKKKEETFFRDFTSCLVSFFGVQILGPVLFQVLSFIAATWMCFIPPALISTCSLSSDLHCSSSPERRRWNSFLSSRPPFISLFCSICIISSSFYDTCSSFHDQSRFLNLQNNQHPDTALKSFYWAKSLFQYTDHLRLIQLIKDALETPQITADIDLLVPELIGQE